MEIINQEDGSFVDFSIVTISTTEEFASIVNSTPVKPVPVNASDLNNNVLLPQEKASNCKSATTTQLTCEFCDRSFTRKDNLKRHSHSHVQDTFCRSVCSRRFESEELLETHKQAHQRILCNICGSSFLKKSHLSEHQKMFQ